MDLGTCRHADTAEGQVPHSVVNARRQDNLSAPGYRHDHQMNRIGLEDGLREVDKRLGANRRDHEPSANAESGP